MSGPDVDVMVSVVIPTYNRRDRLDRVLHSLAGQRDAGPFEVLVVSDGSTDGTDEYLRSGATPIDVIALTQSNRGPAVARNLGVEHARGDMIVFLDDDVVADPHLVRAHRDAHRAAGDSAVVIGPMLDPDDHVMSPWVRWEQRMLAKQYRAMSAGEFEPTFRQFYTGNASIMRKDVIQAGGFDPRYRRAEDVEFAIRAAYDGCRFVFEPEARGFHYAERSFESWRGIARSYGQLEVEFSRGVGGDPALGFVTEKFDEQHRAVRAVVRLALRWQSATDAVIPRTQRLIDLLDRRRPTAGIGQMLLSLIYATDYWRALANAAGGPAAMYEQIETTRAWRRAEKSAAC